MFSRLQFDVTIHFYYLMLIFTIIIQRYDSFLLFDINFHNYNSIYDSLLLFDVDFHFYNSKFKFKKIRTKRNVEIRIT